MIAASDPQEFIPGGRQQATRHPGPSPHCNNLYSHNVEDDFLHNRLERVSLAESGEGVESWLIRKTSNAPAKDARSKDSPDERCDYNKSFVSTDNRSHSEMLFDDSWTSSMDTNLSSKTNRAASFRHSKRFSNEIEMIRSESKSSLNTNKSFAGNSNVQTNNTQNVRFKSELDYMEEELYCKGKVVIWTKGLSYNPEDKARTTICSFSSPVPIKQAIWCTFYEERPEFYSKIHLNDDQLDQPQGEPLSCVCVIEERNLKVFTADSEDFVASLPFNVHKVWKTKFGVLIEKERSEKNREIIVSTFSLSHPLDEINPVAICKQGCTQLLTDENLEIVFTLEEPSLCMVFDRHTGLHSVYRIRRVKSDEVIECPNKTNASQRGYTSSNKLKNHLSMMDVNKSYLQQGISPFSSKANSFASLSSQFPSRNQSPMPGPSRCQTPLISPAPTQSPWLERLSRLQSSMRTVDTMSHTTERIHFLPDHSTYHDSEPSFCLDYIWSETTTSLQDGVIKGPATKVFITDDLTGQNYLCYFVANRLQLSIVKIDYTNPSSMVFGMLTSISAKDAIAIPHLHMLGILEHTGNIVLYSGLTMVGKLHIGGVLAQHIPSPYAVRKSVKLFTSPFPRRSSLLPNCATATDPRFDEHLLSPVLPALSGGTSSNILQFPHISDTYNLAGDGVKVHLSGLRDAVEDRITLQYSDDSYYRVTLPSIVSSSLVESCINALRQIMQRDATLTLLTRWYSTRNVPGSVDLTMEAEWTIFTTMLLDLLGYDTDQSSDVHIDHATTPSCAAKRKKQSSMGTEADWRYLLATDHHKLNCKPLESLLQLRKIPPASTTTPTNELQINTNSILFPYIRIVHYTLHLLYEDLKLNLLRRDELPLLAKFLSKISSDLGLQHYVMHYWRDFPNACRLYDAAHQLSVHEMKTVTQWSVIPDVPTSIFDYLHEMARGEAVELYPVIVNVNSRSQDVVQICGTYIKGSLSPNESITFEQLVKVITPPGTKMKTVTPPEIRVTNETAAQKAIMLMTEMNINTRDLESYPMGVNFILHDALWCCRECPPTDWPAEAYHLLQRPDLASQSLIIDINHPVKQKNGAYSELNEDLPIINQVIESEQEDGMEEVDGPLLKLRFADDLRIVEARRLLQSSKPVPIVLVQRPDVSDHDFIEEQEKHLYAICTRTMSLPVGRGMFTLRTALPVITQPLLAPTLCLTGKAPPRGTTVDVTHIDTPANMNLWPLFHNGVANGLRIDPEARYIDSTWIVFNKPKTNAEAQTEHAGFLMALGLNGHLKNLSILDTFDYLTKFHEMTSVGVLLGLCSAFRATSNTAITKMLSVHVEALLPPTSMELDVPQTLQVASLVGIGLLYQGTAHRHMTEVLLAEIGRPPGPEMENSVDRESYSLAAGLALGLVNLRQGGKPSGLSDLNVPDTLHYYMIGGNKRPLTGSQKEKYKVPSFQIREGTGVNLDVTAPGATIAIGLMYLGTGNKATADWMAPPDTQYLLDFVRPDFLMLRTLSRALILWNDIRPEKEWVENQVPATIKPYCMVQPSVLLDIDYEAMNQAYCNIIAGACFALGLRYAGSADDTAFQTLLEYCHMFTSLTSKSIADLAGKPTIETCLNVVLISASMVMAGTGNLEIMRIVRYLRRRVGIASSAVVTYGSHLAIHMALGLLFLGGGRCTLSNSPASVAALICALYPKFPTHSNDNRYHLQAFRHLYVLAVEPRLVIPRDITTGSMCYANISVVKLDGTTLTLCGPGLIPDLNTLYKVSIKDERYWPVVFERERNWEQLLKLLSSSGCVDVKQRAGCLSYTEDKQGHRTELARTLTSTDVIPWDPPANTITSFTSDCIVRHFADHFLQLKENKTCSASEVRLKQNLTRCTYDCVVKDKLAVLPLFINMHKLIQDLDTSTSTIDLCQLKIICGFVLKNNRCGALTNADLMLSLHQQALVVFDNWEPQLRDALAAFIAGRDSNIKHQQRLAHYVTFYSIPYCFGSNDRELLDVMMHLQQLRHNSETIDKVLRILGYII